MGTLVSPPRAGVQTPEPSSSFAVVWGWFLYADARHGDSRPDRSVSRF